MAWRTSCDIQKTHTDYTSCKETRFCACRKGSYTLEAAVVLPLMAGFFLAILFFFRVLQVQTGVQTALYYASRKTACEASTVSSQTALLVSAEAYFQKEVRQYESVSKYVRGGSWGVSLLRSDIAESHVNLKADYFIKLPINFFKIRGITVSQCSKSRKWTGDRENLGEEGYVYVAKNGTVYHLTRDCPYLDLSIRAVAADQLSALKNKSDHKYYACSGCVAKNKGAKIVYITDYGTHYHVSLTCSGLKRSVYLIPISEVGEKGACSKCGSP